MTSWNLWGLGVFWSHSPQVNMGTLSYLSLLIYLDMRPPSGSNFRSGFPLEVLEFWGEVMKTKALKSQAIEDYDFEPCQIVTLPTSAKSLSGCVWFRSSCQKLGWPIFWFKTKPLGSPGVDGLPWGLSLNARLTEIQKWPGELRTW